MKRLVFALLATIISNISYAGSISLVYDGNMIPEPNEEITIYIHSDAPLFCMGAGVVVAGDAEIIDAMDTADCNQFGWDNTWYSEPYYESNWVYVSGVKWESDVNGVVSYIKFVYHSGEVDVSFYPDQDWNCAFDGDCNAVPFLMDTLIFGEGEMMQGGGGDFSEQQDVNQPSLPLAASNKPEATLFHRSSGGPADANSLADWASRLQDFSELAQTSIFAAESEYYEEPNWIEIDSDITTNRIWSKDNIYLVTEPVNVQALLVIEPGTLVLLDDGCGLFVNNGGTLISKGTPDAPIIYTPYIFPYYCWPIWIEETASPATTVSYNYIEYAFTGIETVNIQLDHPIENNYLFDNGYGILEYGPRHTDIRNNLCMSDGTSGIEVYLSSDYPDYAADANTVINIKNNTCFGQSFGIYIHGVTDADKAGTVNLLNNIVSYCGYGLYLLNGGEYAWLLVGSTGYFENGDNRSSEEFPSEYNPVEIDDFPFASGLDYVVSPFIGNAYVGYCYLKQDCPFVNSGIEYIEQTPLIGMTTNIYGSPDCNKIDIGFHHFNWHHSNVGGEINIADLNCDLTVDLADFALFAKWWNEDITEDPNSWWADIDWTGHVDYGDLYYFAQNWLAVSPPLPNILATVSGDANSIQGDMQIGIAGYAANTYVVFALIDGELIGNVSAFEEGESLNVNSARFANGAHTIKVIAIDGNEAIITSPIAYVTFNNAIECITASTYFSPQEDYTFASLYPDPLVLTITDVIDGNEVFTEEFTGSIVVPANTFSDYAPILDVNISVPEECESYRFNSEQDGFQTQTLSTSTTLSLRITEEPDKDPQKRKSKLVRMVISFNDAWLALRPPDSSGRNLSRLTAIQSLIRNLRSREIPFVVLSGWYARTEIIKDYVVRNPNVGAWYHCGHGRQYKAWGTDTVKRIALEFDDLDCFPWLNRDLGDPSLEDPANTLAPQFEKFPSFGFDLQDSGKLKVVFLDSCYANKLNDWAKVTGMYSLHNQTWHDQILIGWQGDIDAGDFIHKDPALRFPYTTFVNRFLEYFTDINRHTVDESLNEARSRTNTQFPGENYGSEIYSREFGSSWLHGYGIPQYITFTPDDW